MYCRVACKFFFPFCAIFVMMVFLYGRISFCGALFLTTLRPDGPSRPVRTIVILALLLQLDGATVLLNVSDWSARSLLDVIRRNLLPPLIQFSRDASRLISLSNIFNHVLLFTTHRSDSDTSAVDAFAQTANVFQGQVR